MSIATGVQQPTNRESAVQASAIVKMPSQNESQIITQQIEASLPERAKVRRTGVLP
jgi:hypothetical protein